MTVWNNWDEIEHSDDLKPVSVVVPARTDQTQLRLFLRLMEAQDYPLDLLEIVVVDHSSPVPLEVPVGTGMDVRVVRLESGHGPGAARSFGASLARHDILLFLDVDILASASMVRNYVRWPIANPLAVGLGFRDFIDPKDVNSSEFEFAITEGRAEEHLRSLPTTEGQEWIDAYLRKCDDARSWRDDLWVIVVGAGIAVSRKMYEYAGGFRDFAVHGIEDTEFGFRLFQAGAVIVPDRDATGYHIGLRSISRDRDQINWRRAGGLANNLPHPRYRAPLVGRSWTVPAIIAQILVGSIEDSVLALRTTDDLLTGSYTDLGVVIYTQEGVDDSVLRSYFDGDQRVRFRTGSHLEVPRASPLTLRCRAGVRFASTSLEAILKVWRKDSLGLACLVAGSDDVTIEVWRTSALARAHFVGDGSPAAIRESLRESFDERWLPAGNFDISFETGSGSAAYRRTTVPAGVYYR